MKMTDKKPEDLEGAMKAQREDVLKRHDSYSIADLPNGERWMAELPEGLIDIFGRLSPEEIQRVNQRVKELYQENPQFYVGTSQPLNEVLGRATYVGPSVQETEAIEQARQWFAKYKGVKKE